MRKNGPPKTPFNRPFTARYGAMPTKQEAARKAANKAWEGKSTFVGSAMEKTEGKKFKKKHKQKLH